MQAFKIEATLAEDGSVTLTGLPFRAGDRIEVIVLGNGLLYPNSGGYPLRGTPFQYDEPMAAVAEADWEALQ